MLNRSAPPWVVILETRRQRAIRQITVAALSLLTTALVVLLVLGG